MNVGNAINVRSWPVQSANCTPCAEVKGATHDGTRRHKAWRAIVQQGWLSCGETGAGKFSHLHLKPLQLVLHGPQSFGSLAMGKALRELMPENDDVLCRGGQRDSDHDGIQQSSLFIINSAYDRPIPRSSILSSSSRDCTATTVHQYNGLTDLRTYWCCTVNIQMLRLRTSGSFALNNCIAKTYVDYGDHLHRKKLARGGGLPR